MIHLIKFKNMIYRGYKSKKKEKKNLNIKIYRFLESNSSR